MSVGVTVRRDFRAGCCSSCDAGVAPADSCGGGCEKALIRKLTDGVPASTNSGCDVRVFGRGVSMCGSHDDGTVPAAAARPPTPRDVTAERALAAAGSGGDITSSGDAHD